ncbi:hypothetical protein ACCC93_26415, partial [Herbaspirillum frisingense]
WGGAGGPPHVWGGGVRGGPGGSRPPGGRGGGRPPPPGDASGLYSAARNLGGSLALAAIAVIQDQRLWLHSRRLEESLSANSDLVQSGIGAQAQLLGGQDAAIQLLGSTIQAQALTMTYADLFWMLGVAILCVTPLVLFLRPLPTHAAPVASH